MFVYQRVVDLLWYYGFIIMCCVLLNNHVLYLWRLTMLALWMYYWFTVDLFVDLLIYIYMGLNGFRLFVV